MSRVTVRWYLEAEEELAELWLAADDQGSIEAAANEIDVLLSLNPGTKGRPYALATLDEESIALLQARVAELPEDLRWFRCGPIEVYFRPLEDDGMVLVMHLRARQA
jgi:hypothetical protein